LGTLKPLGEKDFAGGGTLVWGVIRSQEKEGAVLSEKDRREGNDSVLQKSGVGARKYGWPFGPKAFCFPGSGVRNFGKEESGRLWVAQLTAMLKGNN